MTADDRSPGRLEDLPLTLCPKEVQEVLRIGRRQVYLLLQTGALGSVRIGRSYRIPRIELLRFLGLDGAAAPREGDHQNEAA